MRLQPWLPLACSALLACTGSIASSAGQEREPASGSLDGGTSGPSSGGQGQAPSAPANPDAGFSPPSTPLDGGSQAPIDAGASPPDEANGDAGSQADNDGGTAVDPGTSAALHDDFESDTIDPQLWTLRGFEGGQMPHATTATLDLVRAHSGSQSVHIRDGFLEAKTPGASFYGRMYAWLDAEPGTGHWMTAVALGPGPGNGRDTEVRYGGHYGILEANYFGNDDEVISDPQGYCSPTCDNGVVMPVKRWACVEFYYGKDEMRLWLDGVEIETLHVTEWRNQKAPWSPAYDRVRVGFHNFQGSSPSLWLDDVAFDQARIGCKMP